MKRWALWLGVMLAVGSGKISAQDLYLQIYKIQDSGAQTNYINQDVRTEGVVTLTLFGEGQLGGFFIQDTLGDNNPATSDAIFVYGQKDVAVGDYVMLTGTVSEYKSRTQMKNPKNMVVMGHNVGIPYTQVHFSDIKDNAEGLECMALEFLDTLYLNSAWNAFYGSVEVGSKRHRAPTDYNLPASDDYRAAVAFNAADRLALNCGGSVPSPNPMLDGDGTCRTGNFLVGFKCIFDQQDQYQAYSADGRFDFIGNPRTAAPNEDDLGDYDTKICGFNLERFFNREDLQRTRIINAVKAINADIYGFVEVGGGTSVINRLIEEMNKAKGADVYDFIRYTGYEPTSDYTLNHIVYDKTKWEPYKDYCMISKPTPNRKLIQCLRNKQNGFMFIFNINHFKAKSGTGSGADADQGDGQGIYNNTRTREAATVVDKLDLMQYYYGTTQILSMGDFNAFYMEDPIRKFTDAGYIEENHRFHDDQYSYCYNDYNQYLDYALASPDFDACVTGATIWHINADEPSHFDFERDPTRGTGPYRCSDHDPVIVGFSTRLSAGTEMPGAAYQKLLRLHPNPAKGDFRFIAERAGRVEVRSLQGALIWSAEVGEGETCVSAERWPAGVYFVSLATASGDKAYAKLIKK